MTGLIDSDGDKHPEMFVWLTCPLGTETIQSLAGLKLLESFRTRQCFLSNGHLYKGNNSFYWNSSKGTKAMARGTEASTLVASMKYQACTCA